METPLDKAKAHLRQAIEDADLHRYQAAIHAAKVRRDNDKPVNTRNLAQAKEELAFYQHLHDVINGAPLEDEHQVRVKSLLQDGLDDVDPIIQGLKDSE
jgi:hypothetical protein